MHKPVARAHAGHGGSNAASLVRRRNNGAAGEPTTATAADRERPCYAVLDDEMQFVACSRAFEATYGPWQRAGSAELGDAVRALVARDRLPAGTAAAELSDSTVLRLTRLDGPVTLYLLSVEGVRRGSNLREIVERFGLARREGEVLGLMLQGKSYAEIAERLAIGGATVATHVRNIGNKLGCSKRSSIVARALGLM